MSKSKKVWVADDDESIRFVLEKGLIDAGFEVSVFEDGNEVVNQLDLEKPNVLLTDLKMPGRDGMDLLDTFKNEFSNIPVIMMTAHSDLDTTVDAFENGAWDYIAKPFDLNDAISKISKALDERKIRSKKRNKEDEITLEKGKIIGKSPAMQDLFNSIGKLSHSDSTVLLVGESGTGKELVARAIYEHSERADKKLISLNMADIPIELLESELFGYEKGAFTGAEKKKIGRFEQAHKATLFLDEIGDMPYETQTRILRVLSSGEFYRIGGSEPITVDVRIIAATNQNLNEKVKTGVLFLVDASDKNLKINKLITVDKTRTFHELVLKNVDCEILEQSTENIEIVKKVVDAGRIILAADTLGASESMIEKAVAYSKERKQFNRTIGSFQAVKHMCAEMAADLEPCYSLVWQAAHSFEKDSSEESRLLACQVKSHLSEIGKSVSKKATEVHGGMGFTDLLGLHYWFKRIGLNRQILGAPEIVREEAAEIQGFNQ